MTEKVAAFNRLRKLRVKALRHTSQPESRLALPVKEGPESHDSQIPDCPWTHKLVMGLVVGLPFMGCIAAAALLWQGGFVGWLYMRILVGGWLLTGNGIT